MKTQTRSSFLIAGLSLVVAAFWKWKGKPAKKNTVKFLGRDGKLVKVDVSLLSAARRPASKEEVQGWVNKK